MTTRPLVLGHRGASAAAPENTLAAYRLALTLGADGFELDVRCSADGDLVLHHDASLPDGRLIAATPTAALSESVPTLAAALDLALAHTGPDGRPAMVNVEIKNIPGELDFDPECAIASIVGDLFIARGLADRVLVSSFHLATLDRAKAVAPTVPTGLLTFIEPSAAAMVPVVAARGHQAINPYGAFVDADLVDAAHALGLAVNVWTVNDPVGLAALADLGVDAVITDVPDVALATYAGRSDGPDETS